MKVEPSGAELLRVARQTLLEELLPQLPAQSHYAARMAANAMAIATRELEGAGGDPAAEVARVRGLLPEWQPSGDIDEQVRDANAKLAAAVRNGRFDSAQAQAVLLDHLRKTTEERLAVSAPQRK
jgi:hypothetical protein